MTEPNCAEFDELHRTWLARPDIEIGELTCLAHGYPPGTFGRITDPDAQPHYRALKALIKRKLLPHHSDGSAANVFTVITLKDLLKCLELDEVASDPSYDWLRKFAERWRRYCTLPAIKVDDAGRIKPRATYDVDEVTRTYQRERARLDPFPTEKEDKEWFQRNFPDLPRAIWRDQIRAKIAPDDARKRGPRSKVAR